MKQKVNNKNKVWTNFITLDSKKFKKILTPSKKDYDTAVDLFLIGDGEHPSKKQIMLAKILRHMENMFPDSFKKDIPFIRKNINEMEDSKLQGGTSLNLLQDIIEKKCLEIALIGINNSIIEKRGATNIENINMLKARCIKANISDDIINIFLTALINSVVNSVNREVDGDRERVISVSQFVHFFSSKFLADVSDLQLHKYFRNENQLYWKERSNWQNSTKRGRKREVPVLNKKVDNKSFKKKVLNYLIDLSAEYLNIFFGDVVLRKYELASSKINIPSVKTQKCWAIDGKDDNEILQSIIRANALIGTNTPRVTPPLPYNRTDKRIGMNSNGKKLCNHNGLSRKVVEGDECDHSNVYLNKINTLQSIPFTLSIQMLCDVISIIDYSTPIPVDDFYPENKKCRNNIISKYIESLRKQLTNSLELMKDSDIQNKYSYLVPKYIILIYTDKHRVLNENIIKEQLSDCVKNNGGWVSNISTLHDEIKVEVSGNVIYDNNTFIIKHANRVYKPKVSKIEKYTLYEWAKKKQVKRFKSMIDRFIRFNIHTDSEKTRRCMITLIVYSYCFDNKPLYFPIITDHRGRMYTEGENNPINSKLFRKFVILNGNIPVDRDNSYLDYYILSQIEKQKSIDLKFNTSNVNLEDVRSFVELAKIKSCMYRNTTFSVGMDATSSVCQHLSVLAQDKQLMIDSNVITLLNNEENVSKDVYESIINHIISNNKIDKAIKHLCSDRSFVKLATMKLLYNSTSWKIAKDINKDNKDKYSIWEEKLVIKAASACMSAFRERYPKAYKLKVAIGSYGDKVYKEAGRNMIFKLNDQTISYTHKDTDSIPIFLTVRGQVKRIRVDVKLLNTDKTLKNKGKSSTAVNLIHATDAKVLMDSRFELYLYNEYIKTLGIHDCYLCHPNYIYEIIKSYSKHTLEQINLETVLPDFKYPKDHECINTRDFKPSSFCLMPT